MDYKKAQEILLKLLQAKNTFSTEEKEAVMKAIGVLDFAVLGKKRSEAIIRAKKAKKDKAIKW